ncbi:peptidoglycan-binding domain-containing protein [Microvirga makkahensis]
MQLLHEREVAAAAKADLIALQSQVAALRKEIDDLSQRRSILQAQPRPSRGGESDGNVKLSQPNVSETGSITTLDHPEKVFVTTAQKALTKLGYGPLAADGVMGPSTRQAIEEFQYKNGLPVTRELDMATLQRLGQIDSVAAAD